MNHKKESIYAQILQNNEYFQSVFSAYPAFGLRLKKWRELNRLKKKDFAEKIYCERQKLNLTYSPLQNIIQLYGRWENSTDSSTLISLNNLSILKRLMNVDYEFFFCEIDTLHKYTSELIDLTGLSISTIEKLTAYAQSLSTENESCVNAHYHQAILSALNKVIASDDFMRSLNNFLFTPLPSENALLTVIKSDSQNEIYTLHQNDLTNIYRFSLINQLCQLRDSENYNTTIAPSSLSYIPICDNNDSFGKRIYKWRISKEYTQENVAALIADYRTAHQQHSSSIKSIIRLYQNWEQKYDDKKELRLSLNDIQMLKNIMNCDYEYLFGECNSLKQPSQTPQQLLGITASNIQKLISYKKTSPNNILATIDLLLADNNILSDFAYFLTNLTA